MAEVPVGMGDVEWMSGEVGGRGIIDVEENEGVAPEGNPDWEKATDCAVPETSAAPMELETEAPWVTVLLPPLLREKLKEVDAGFTVKLKVVVRSTVPAVPVTVMA